MSYRGERGRGGFDRGRGGRGSPSDRGRNSPSGFRGGDRGGRGGGGDRGGRGFDRGGDRGGGRGFDRGGDRGGGRGFDRGRGRGFGAPREQGGVFLQGQPATVDARIADDSDKALVASLRTTQLGNDPDSMPLRPDFGSAGVQIKLRTNFFPVRVPKGPLYEYDVSITPAAGTAIRRVKRRIFQLAEQTTEWQQAGMRNAVAHDSSSKLISARVLAQPLTIKVPYYDEDPTGPPAPGGKEYTLAIKFIQEINTQDLMSYLNGDGQYRNYNILPVISALNLILAAHPLRSGIKVGQDRYFFRSAAPPSNLGGGLEAWKGFYSSVRPSHRQLMVNVNVCTTAFYTPGNLAVQMVAFSNSSFGARMEAFCKSVRVKATHLGYRKTVKGLARQNARQYTFSCDELGGQVSVEQYFLQKYKIRLQHPDLPLVDVGGQKKNYLPAEVCEILPDQPFRGKLTDEHTASMITVACQPPNVNGNAIVNSGLAELGFTNPGPTLNAFGVSIGPNMAVVPGRILPRPGLKYANNVSPAVDDRASWNLRNIRFAVGARLEKWAVLLIGDRNSRDEFQGPQDPALRDVITGFMGMCRNSGIAVSNEQPQVAAANLPPPDRSDPLRKMAINVIRERLIQLRPKPSMVLVMLSSGDKNIYEGLKHLCDVYLDVATVCVHVAKIRKEKGQPQYFANVALKVNMKMGGVNHKLDENTGRWLSGEPTMVVGMDVTHPGPGSARGTPSIAAVVASVDNHFAQYPASLEIQESRKEMITNLKDMMVARLQLFKQHSKVLPKRVLVYRDGVSEGQFNIVRMEELPEIVKAFHTFDQPKKPYRPKLTIVICGKRHHTRFYPTEGKDAANDGNPKPGTVVDRGVTAVYDFDFFLQAHGGLQGTTKPTHYYVVHDEIGFGADGLQGLTNALSYMFARATKAVSLVSPAYYADVACERGRCYLRKLLQGQIGDGTTASGSTNEQDVMKEAQALWRTGVSKSLKDTMFYL
ncbi:Piwi domain-containing protein [Suillus clintonianus]|uniref:Piwi domain-containing protein n=1 Tax=Suillus clintonianus TaxID=1904413 RepID=UPI001B884BFC|nr:Piwi domain-containing protein [Suillus clintonianus]KAG2136022.1 Piwi domain-containing protein [Suillus clintonianus]